jgi:putative membrane protein
MNTWVASIVLIVAGGLSIERYLAKILELGGPYGVSPVATLALFAFTLIHGRVRLGTRRLVVLTATTCLVTFGMEAFSIATGLVGNYSYTDALGPTAWGVPLLIPAAWLMMLYPTLMMIETCIGAPPVRTVRDRHGLGVAIACCVGIALVVGVAMTAWDVGVETIIVVTGEYHWQVPGGYFGVPIPNFVGWVATSAAAALAFLVWELTIPPRPAAEPGAAEWLPIAAYATAFLVTALGNYAHGNNAAVVVTTFAMLPFLLLASARLAGRRIIEQRSAP